MFVYFIRAGNQGAIKIGVASDIKQRLEQLQTGNAFELKVLALIPCSCLDHAYDTERRIHKFFAGQRIRGEWFKGDINFSKISDMKVDVDGNIIDQALKDARTNDISRESNKRVKFLGRNINKAAKNV